ncbi:NAD(+) synthase [Hoylesella marshii]|uniref:Glutamine-dependent NAD(+) synthetase n=1 Tax=Hoylesella marshii DSM 16973 = JCM 13450 TaxID=862515 RepID=E0NQN6_9BACT|nr:NAD(+) synthase [Hoylesella marshii]EFM02610.1 NAD+ synthase [Hoylesella marshii DSM 16973 = JCM 13450]
MNHYGYIKVAAAVPNVQVADCDYNAAQIETLIARSEAEDVEIVVFPELSVTGYSCQDLFRQQTLLHSAEQAMERLLDFTRSRDVIAIVGCPLSLGNLLLNCAVVIQHGELLGIVPKTFLPNYNEFYERRWFASSRDLQPTEIVFAGKHTIISPAPILFRTQSRVTFGVEICEDVWTPQPPSTRLALSGAEVIFNLSASNDLIGKHAYLRTLLMQQSARTISGYVYSGCGWGESTQDVVYGGNAIIAENGRLIAEGERFSLHPQLIVSQIDTEKLCHDRLTDTTFTATLSAEHLPRLTIIDCLAVRPRPFHLCRNVEPLPFIPRTADLHADCEEILNIQATGLAHRLTHIRCRSVVLGISGGLDSTLALLVCVRAFDKLGYDRRGIVGVTMPGFGTTDRTHDNAVTLMESLGVTLREINISTAVLHHFKDIGHDPSIHDVTYENAQARERTQILMDMSNELGAIVVGTGDLSELALGWATYNGDHISMYGVNAGVPKTLIRHLVRHVADFVLDAPAADTLRDIIDTPISPELIPADEHGHIQQKTEDLVGPYELHDFFLYHMIRHGFAPAKLFMLACAAFNGHRPDAGSYDAATIKHWLTVFIRRFFSQQFKRSCTPDAPKIGSISLSPRGDWRMPSDATARAWLDECKQL